MNHPGIVFLIDEAQGPCHDQGFKPIRSKDHLLFYLWGVARGLLGSLVRSSVCFQGINTAF